MAEYLHGGENVNSATFPYMYYEIVFSHWHLIKLKMEVDLNSVNLLQMYHILYTVIIMLVLIIFFKYRISRPIRRTFFYEKCDLNSTCVLCAEGKYYFHTYKYPYIYYKTSLSWDNENNHEDNFSGSDDDFLGFYDE